ncbi:unnamed protein product [Ambrosiozyma monospora]|uniref:Unnamed protein product n=1 Tax=Ambrosiozyma monospora TaxID=43982 RepID=A0ACB5T8P7_AMBMO|nr:unnamed protein product [Ambrosiozyma monospora]
MSSSELKIKDIELEKTKKSLLDADVKISELEQKLKVKVAETACERGYHVGQKEEQDDGVDKDGKPQEDDKKQSQESLPSKEERSEEPQTKIIKVQATKIRRLQQERLHLKDTLTGFESIVKYRDDSRIKLMKENQLLKDLIMFVFGVVIHFDCCRGHQFEVESWVSDKVKDKDVVECENSGKKKDDEENEKENVDVVSNKKAGCANEKVNGGCCGGDVLSSVSINANQPQNQNQVQNHSSTGKLSTTIASSTTTTATTTNACHGPSKKKLTEASVMKVLKKEMLKESELNLLGKHMIKFLFMSGSGSSGKSKSKGKVSDGRASRRHHQQQ